MNYPMSSTTSLSKSDNKFQNLTPRGAICFFIADILRHLLR